MIGTFAELSGQRFGAILADPPWRFANRTGKVAPEHRRLARYQTMSLEELCGLPVHQLAAFAFAPSFLLSCCSLPSEHVPTSVRHETI